MPSNSVYDPRTRVTTIFERDALQPWHIELRDELRRRAIADRYVCRRWEVEPFGHTDSSEHLRATNGVVVRFYFLCPCGNDIAERLQTFLPADMSVDRMADYLYSRLRVEMERHIAGDN